MQIFNLNHTIQIMSNQWCGTREQRIDKVAALVCRCPRREKTSIKNTAPNYRLLLLIVIYTLCPIEAVHNRTELFPSLKGTCFEGFIHLKTIYWTMIERFSRSIGYFRRTCDYNTEFSFINLVIKKIGLSSYSCCSIFTVSFAKASFLCLFTIFIANETW